MATLFMPQFFFSLATFFMPFSVLYMCFEKNRFEVFPSSKGVGSLLMTIKGPISEICSRKVPSESGTNMFLEWSLDLL